MRYIFSSSYFLFIAIAAPTPLRMFSAVDPAVAHGLCTVSVLSAGSLIALPGPLLDQPYCAPLNMISHSRVTAQFPGEKPVTAPGVANSGPTCSLPGRQIVGPTNVTWLGTLTAAPSTVLVRYHLFSLLRRALVVAVAASDSM